MNTVETLADFIDSFPFGRIPPATRAMAEDCVLDAVGAGVAGFSTKGAGAVRTVAADLLGNGPATVWFVDGGASPAGAAFSNSMAVSALDIDDGHRVAVGHPGAAVITAAIATAEATGADGADLLADVVLGYEAAVRLSAARDNVPSIATGRWGAFATAATAGRLRRMPRDRLANALLIAENHAPNLLAADLHGFGGSHVKEGIAWSVLTGFAALDLAEAGFIGYPDTLDKPRLYDARRVIEGLGETFYADRTYFKLYSCCRAIHPAVDGLLALMAEHRLSADDIEAVRVDGCALMVNLDNRVDPPNFEAAQFSVPFGVAIAAIEGEAGLLPLRPDFLGRTDLIDFARRVSLCVDPEFEAAFPLKMIQRVTIETSRGPLEKRVDHARGDPANPLGRGGLQAKFRRLTAPSLTAERQETMITAATTLQADGLPRLLAALRPPLSAT